MTMPYPRVHHPASDPATGPGRSRARAAAPARTAEREPAGSSAGARRVQAASRLAPLLLGAAALAGCAGLSDPTGLLKGGDGAKPAAAGTLPERPADAGPGAPTAVIEETYTFDGAIMPVMRGQSRVETRADMRRTDSAVTFDNWMIRQLAGDGRSSDIVRLDRKIVWRLEHAKKSYTECPLTGCVAPAGDGKPAPERRPDEAKKPPEPTCPVSVKVNDLKVDATGERKTVNGFPTQRFKVGWTIELVDGAGQRNGHWVQLDLWTTPEAGEISQAKAIADGFDRQFAAAMTSADNPVGRYLPPNVVGPMASLMKNFDAKDRATVARWGAETRKIQGYPIVTTMSWTTQGAVCTDAKGGQPSATDVASKLGEMFGGRKADGSPAPLITFSQEVRTIAVKPVANAAFSPPADYQRKN